MQISGDLPHPVGKISVNYNLADRGFRAEVVLPEGVTGTFVWKGKSYELKAGKNNIEL